MSWGFSVSRATGEVLVDEEHITLASIHRGSITTPSSPSVYWGGKGPVAGYYYADGTYGGRYKVSYPSPITSDAPPIVALVPGPFYKGWFHAFRNIGQPGRWTGFEIAHQAGFTSKRSSLSEFNTGWDYVAANPEACPRSSERFGLRVFSSQGRLVFDSGTPIMRIASPLLSWARINSALFEHAWPFPLNGEYGVLASSLVMYLEEGTNFGSIFVSPRIGFNPDRPGKVLMSFERSDSWSASQADPVGGFEKLLTQTGGLRTFAVKVPR